MPKAVGHSQLKIALVDKVRRKQYSLPFSSRHSGDIVLDGSIVDNLIPVDNESMFREDVVLIDIRGND